MAELLTIDLSGIKDPAALEIIRFLLEENRQLRERVQALEEKIARLEKNSSTSSKPPSSDITKPPHEQRQPGKRRAGGQPKHPGHRRALLPPEQVDHVEELELSVCPDCGVELEAERHQDVLIQQSIELPEKPIWVVEYRQYGHRCACCGKWHYAALPEGVREGQLFGPRLQALVAYLKGNLGASYTEVSQFCCDVLGVKVSRGMICRVIARVNKALAQPCHEVEEALPREAALNIDESGWKNKGQRYWVWLFCTPLIAYFTIKRSRGSEVLKQVLGETFGGAIVSDFFSAYVKFANAKQQFCLAHLIRDIKFLTTLPDLAARQFGEDLLRYFRLVFKHWHARDAANPELLRYRIERVQRQLYTYLCDAEAPKGPARTMKSRLVKHWPALFRFAAEPTLYDPTNNRAEQTMRHVVRIRRQTQGTRSVWGQQWCGRIMTVLATCRKQNRSAWEFIRDAVTAYQFETVPPSLLPTGA